MDPNNDNVLYNLDKYVEYCAATQQVWRFQDLRIRHGEDYRKIFKAIAASQIAEEFSIRLENFSEKSEARAFIDALQQNTSLLKLTLYIGSEIMNEQLCALLDVLGEKNQLRHLFMYSVEWNEQIFASLVRFLEKSSKLIHLQLPDGNFSDAQYLQLLDVISKHNELLVRTDLGEAEHISDETIEKIAVWLNNRPQHILFECYGGDNRLSELVEKKGLFSETYDWGSVKPKEHTKLYLEPNSVQQFWEVLPRDMTKKILYQLNITHLMAFIKSSKATMSLQKQWSFWKEYYLTHFSCVPNECLDMINFVMGERWLQMSDLTQMKDFDVWLEIIQSLLWKCDKSRRPDFPVNRIEIYQLLIGPVLRKYPQLINELNDHLGTRNRHEIGGYGHPAQCFTWIYAAVPKGWFHFGVELMPSGQLNAISLLGSDSYLASISDRLQRLRYIFEWTTARNGEELSEKIAPLVEVLLSGQERKNGCYWQSGYIKSEVCEKLDRVIKVKRGDPVASIEKHTQQILAKCHVTFNTCLAFTKLIDSMTQHVKDQPEAVVPDYIAFKQKTISRAEMNKKYCIGERRFNFNEARWVYYDGEETKKKINQPPKQHNREQKISSSASLQRLMRVCLNYIMMPVLKAFWRLSPTDPEYRLYPHMKWYNMADYFSKLPTAPLEHVSVSHAQPQAWPVIAVAVARLIMSPVCRVIETVIDRTWTSKQTPHHNNDAVQSRGGDSDDEFKTRLDTLIGGLTRIGLMPNEHLLAIRSLFNKLAEM